MKYFSLQQIRESIEKLRPHHPIFGTTFLVLKQANVPVGEKISFHLDRRNHEFLRKYYRAHPKSDCFFKVLRQRARRGEEWVKPNYASTGLQKMNTTTLRGALLHDRNKNTWGFNHEYVKELRKVLPRRGDKVPLFHLAVLFLRVRAWAVNTSRMGVVSAIADEFNK